MPLIDGRPGGLDARFRPGNTFAVALTWPAGELAGRTFAATLDAASLAVDIVGDVMTLTASEAQTTAAAVDATFVLTETSGGLTQDVLVGKWEPSTLPGTPTSVAVNVTTDAAQVQVTVVPHAAPSPSPFIEIPSGWGTRWRAARADPSTLARVIHIGDSVAQGRGCTPNWFSGYGGQVGDRLRAAYGNGGTGLVVVDFGVHTGNNLSSGWPVPTTGAWTTLPNDAGSVNGHSVRPSVDGNGATMTFTMDCDTSVTIYSRTDPTYGRYDYKIDGGSAVQVPQNVAAGVQATVVAVTPGTHTVQVIAAAGTCRMLGVKAEKPTGLAYHNLALAGRQIDDLPTTTGAIAATLAATGDPDLAIITLGVNDCSTAGRTEVEVYGWLATIVRAIHDTELLDPPDIAVVLMHRGNVIFADINGVWPGVYSACRRIAATYGCAVVDVWASGRRSWEVWNALGYWVPADPVHPNNTGADAYADLVTSLLTVA